MFAELLFWVFMAERTRSAFLVQLHELALRKLDKSYLLCSTMLIRYDFLNFFQG